jgi:hypothetical protein
MGNIPGTAYGGAADPSMVQLTEGFRIIPTISASQRYDSNVFYLPAVRGRRDRSDYVSTLSPQIRGLFAGNGMNLNAVVGATASYFVKHTNFNYVGANAGLSLNLGPILDPLWQGMQLTITDTFLYSPQSPAFLVGDQTGSTSNQAGSTSNLLVNGMQPGRVSSTGNTLGTTLRAPLSQTVSLTGGYARGFIRFGTSEVQQIGLLLNTSYQTFNVGVMTKLSPQDTVTLSYLDSSYTYGQTAGSFTTRGGSLAWMHMFSPSLTLNSTAGVQVLEGGLVRSSSVPKTTSPTSGSGSSSISSTIVPTGGLGLTWRDQTTSLYLNYGLSLTPSYQFDAQPLLTNNISFSVAQVMPDPQFVGLLGMNYARADEFGASSKNSISYESYGGTGGVLYKFTPKTFLNFNYQYTKYDSQFGAQGFSIARQVVLLSLTQAFY